MGGDAPPGYVCDPESGVCRKVDDDNTGSNVGNSAGQHPVVALLGDTLLAKSGPVPTKTIVGPQKVIGLYFSAHWCPPCRMFTPFLAGLFTKFKEAHAEKDKFEVVFISSDRDEASFKEYFGEMPWLALPFEKREQKQALSRKFKVQGIPMLVILDGETGLVINSNGREAVSGDEDALNFPWRPKQFSELIAGELVDKAGTTFNAVDALTGKIKLIYFSAHWCPPCRKFTPQLVETYNSLKAAGKNFEVVFVSSDRDSSQFKQYLDEMPWLAVPWDDRVKKGDLSTLFEVEGIPSLVVLDENDNLITANGRGAVAQDPEGKDFPWIPKLVDLLNDFTATMINDAPTVLLALESGDTHLAMERANEVLTNVARTTKATSSDDINFLFGLKSDALMGKVLEFAGVQSEADVLLLIDIPSQAVFVCDTTGPAITTEVASKFITDYLAGQLQSKPLGD